MNYYAPSIPSALSPRVYSPANGGFIVCGSNMNAQSSLFNSSIAFPPANYDGMFPDASHFTAEPETRFAASRCSIYVPQPQRPAQVDGFLQAAQGQTAGLFKGWPVSTGHQSMIDATGRGDSGAHFGGNSYLPKIWTSTSITSPVLPGTPPTHSAASWSQSQIGTDPIMPFDLSDPFVPNFTPAGTATQISSPPPTMPSTSPRVSLFGSPLIGNYPSADDDPHYGAVPESDWGPNHIQAEPIQSLLVAISHAELAQRFCESDPHTTFSPPPAYDSIYTDPTESIISRIDLSAPPRYSSRDSFHQSSPVAGSSPSSSSAGHDTRPGFRSSRSWDPRDELGFEAQSRSAQLPQSAVSLIHFGGAVDDDSNSAVSRLEWNSRPTQNKPSFWDRITTGASRTCRSIFRRGPTHAWS